MELDLELPFHMPHIMDSSLFTTTLTCYTGIKSAHTDFREKSQALRPFVNNNYDVCIKKIMDI